MKKVTITVALVFLGLGFFTQEAHSDEAPLDDTLQVLYKSATPPPDDMKLIVEFTDEELSQEEYAITKVDNIVVHVEGRFVEVIENIGEGAMVKTYPAGTATRGKNTEALPFDKEGQIALMVFHPYYYPTKDTREEYFKKHHKKMKKCYSPGKGNALGEVKLYLSYDGIPSTLGLHDTDNQKSVGKQVSHGCVRMHNHDAMTLAKLILTQSGYDAEKIIRRVRENPHKTITFKIVNGPRVYFERD